MLTLLLVSTLYYNYALRWYFILFGLAAVIVFFYYSNYVSKAWANYSLKSFVRHLFWWALSLRIAFVIFSYFFYINETGIPFEYHAADVLFYDEMGRYGASCLDSGQFDLYTRLKIYSGSAFSDLGYPIYLSVVYFLTDNSILLTRIIKSIWGAWTVILIYRLAQRNFGEQIARMAAILCMLMPNLIFYCASHLKETEMVFMEMLFIERADYLIRRGKFIFTEVLLIVLIGMYMFMFRTVLGAVLFIALLMTLTLSSTRIITWGRRLLSILFIILLVGVMFSNRIEEEVRQITDVDVIAEQQKNMQWRSQRGAKEGLNNIYIKYAGAMIFAPTIFTIPFASMVEILDQEQQEMLNGANFCKNITSFFTIFALLILLKPYNWRRNLLKGEWRRYLLPITVFGGYLVVLVFSNFAQSERFHMPALPLALMFAAYGISKFPHQYRYWYQIWVVLMIVANIAWAWFKLAGRGFI